MRKHPICADCDNTDLSRRQVVRGTVAGIAAASAGIWSLNVTSRAMAVEAATKAAPETLVGQLYKSLTEAQKTKIAFPFDHPLRSEVNNNWMIVKDSIGDILTREQIALVKEIFTDLHTDEYADRVLHQVEHDNDEVGGFDGCSIALFGQPGDMGADPFNGGKQSKFEFVFTGRHVTRRCDGNSVEGEAFGGPIFYGHAAQGFNEKADHPGNIYWYQAKQANELFQALDGKQRKIALLDTPIPRERASKTVALRNSTDGLPGIGVADMSADQKELVRKTMADLLAPFRKADAEQTMKMIEAAGFDKLHMAFYSHDDIGNDRVWDVWQIEGPSMLWYFRGAPHVHTWVHVRQPTKA